MVPNMENQSFKERLANLINAGFPFLYVPTYEERRAQKEIHQIICASGLIRTERNLFVWTQTEGMKRLPSNENDRGSDITNTKDPIRALDAILDQKDPGVFILKDLHVFFGSERGTHPDFILVRKLRDMVEELQISRKNVIFLSPTLTIPSDLEKDMTVLDFDLPNEAEITRCLEDLCMGLSPAQITLTPEDKNRLVKAALGLTMQEAENAFCRAIVTLKGLNPQALDIIHDETNQVVKKTGVLEFVNTNLSLDDIGGLENLKNWLVKRNNTWTEKAQAYHLPAPKGVLITGVPGCGKSLTAKAMSKIWGLPLLKLDMGRIFGGLVGSSEENMRKAIATAEAVAPSILWVDEIEKGFTGIKSGGDSGTSARVFGTFLTWLQDKEKPVFVIATANDISALPPELLRKGRFDEIFFVDLPTIKERQKIFKVHIGKHLAKSTIPHPIAADDATTLRLAQLTEGFTGSEIEQVVISALYEAFYKDAGLCENDIAKAIFETVPLSRTQSEQILSLRNWARERAVLATAPSDREMTEDEDPYESTGKQGGRFVNFDL